MIALMQLALFATRSRVRSFLERLIGRLGIITPLHDVTVSNEFNGSILAKPFTLPDKA